MKKVIYPKFSYIISYGLLMGFIITSVFVIILINSDRFFLNGIVGLNNDIFYLIAIVIFVPFFGALFIRNRRIEIFESEIHLREKLFFRETTIVLIDDITQLDYHDFDKDKRSSYKVEIYTETRIVCVPTKPYKKQKLAQLALMLNEKNNSIVLDEMYKDIIRVYTK